VEFFYHNKIKKELNDWQIKMSRNPSLFDQLSKSTQNRINKLIPEKAHNIITTAIKQMVRAVIFGSRYTIPRKQQFDSLQHTEEAVLKKIDTYKHTAAVEGGITGAGGILLGFVDFPVLLGIKIKLLFDIAAMYGFDVKDYKERLYLLHIFQLAFSSQGHRQSVYQKVLHWEAISKELPEDINAFNWRPFQQEYRDHIDLAKLAQLVPGIGAVVGYVVNYRMIRKLGNTAMNAYRLRLLKTPNITY
jgi:hypothetical protein